MTEPNSVRQAITSTSTGILLVALLLPARAFAQHPVFIQPPPSAVSFLPSVTYRTGGTEASYVAVADFNHDGKPDLAVANAYFTNTIGILLGNGDGTFQRAVPYRTSAGLANTIIPVDLNGDGNLDLVVANQSRCYPCLAEASISVFIGRGDGTFESSRVYDAGGLGFANNGFGPAEIAVADLNGDGKVDVVVSNCAAKRAAACGDGDGVITVLFGNGDGTFQPGVSHNPAVPNLGTGIALGDLNGDGLPDLVVGAVRCSSSTDCPTGQIDVLLGNGDGTFRPPQGYPTGEWSATAVVLADVNHDGHLDVIVGGCSASNCWNDNGVVSVFLGNGDGTLQSAVSSDTGGRLADGIALADFDGDGHLDIVVANVIDQSVGVLLGVGDGSFGPATTFLSGGNFTYSVAAEDVNGDGKPDIVVTSCAVGTSCGGTIPGAVGVLLNNATPSAGRLSF